jgi:hypothetical protein
MRSLEWVLIQSDWCPYRKRRLGPRPTERPCEDTVCRWHLCTKETGLRRHQSCDTLITESSLQNYEKSLSVFKSPACGALLWWSSRLLWKAVTRRALEKQVCREPMVPPTKQGKITCVCALTSLSETWGPLTILSWALRERSSWKQQ